MIIHNLTPERLAPLLYSLVFPRRDFTKLPESVQESYVRDATRLIELLAAL